MTRDAAARRVPAPGVAIRAIALNTFREAIRDRVLYLLLAFALLVIGASRFLSLLTVGSEEKIIKDLGLAAISIFGVLTAVFVGVSLVLKEIERRTVLTLLSNPVRRWQFILGKYLGLLAVLGMNGVVMSAVLFAILAVRGASPWGLTPALLLILVELALVTAVALLFSTFTKPILSAVGTMALWGVGHLSWSFDLLRRRTVSPSGLLLCDAARALVPNLDRLDVKAEAVHGIALPPGYVAWGAVYGLSYAALVLLLACVTFERRDFA